MTTKIPVQRTAKQKAAAAAQQLGAEAAETAAAEQSAAQAVADQTAQIANLLIAGHTYESIGAQIGASAAEVERMVTQNTARYVRSQPSLRIWVRNFLASKYTTLLDAVWDEATDKNHREKLEHQDRALRILREMRDLHGAAAPKQTEVTIEAGSETIEAVVQRIAAAQGLDYDADIFDADVVEDGDGAEPVAEQMSTAVHQGPAAALRALETASKAVDDDESEDML